MKLHIGEGPRTGVGAVPASSHGFTDFGATRATHRLGAVRSLSGAWEKMRKRRGGGGGGAEPGQAIVFWGTPPPPPPAAGGNSPPKN